MKHRHHSKGNLNGNKVLCPNFPARQGLGKLPLAGLLIKVEDSRKKLSGMTGLFDNSVKAFTLIELLVVVLIIGILAAVALPQYNKAVAKSRLANIHTYLNAIKTANEVYYLANGNYTASLADLDLEVPCNLVQDNTAFQCDDYFVIDNLAGTIPNIRAAYCPHHTSHWDRDCYPHRDFMYTIWLDHSDYPGKVECVGVNALGRAVCGNTGN